MTMTISSRTALFVAQTTAKPGPKAIPFPSEESTAASSPRREVSKASVIAPSRADFGATIDTQTAQDPPGVAQEGAGAGGDPALDPGLQDASGIFGDINGDGQLNGDDIIHLLKAFNSSVTAADLNADGIVDTADLGILINAIRELNSKTKPDNTPGDGLVRDARPISSVNFPPEPERTTEPGLASFDPGDPVVRGPGNHDDPVPQPGVLGDLDGDGIVNGDDLKILQRSFGQSDTIGDLNGDGRVDTADLGMMLGILNRQSNS